MIKGSDCYLNQKTGKVEQHTAKENDGFKCGCRGMPYPTAICGYASTNDGEFCRAPCGTECEFQSDV